MHELWELIDQGLGLGERAPSMTREQILLRAVLVYLAGYAMLRIGEHRFVGKNTAFDVVLGFILGSLLSRAINGDAPLLGTLLAGILLLLLHWVFTTLALYSGRLNTWLNGRATCIIDNGQLMRENMRKKRIDEQVLHENLRLNGRLDDPRQVEAAYYERNGSISVLPKKSRGAHVVKVNVEAGVQTVRIELTD